MLDSEETMDLIDRLNELHAEINPYDQQQMEKEW